jgi:hypothetical protein
MNDRNPVDQVGFYTKEHPDTRLTVTKSHVSLMIPDVFEEHYVRVFARRPEKIEAIKRAFRVWLSSASGIVRQSQ